MTTNAITPQMILDAARKAGLRLIPGAYLTWEGDELVGCCAAGALVVAAHPEILKDRCPLVSALLHDMGLDGLFRGGLTNGFDGLDRDDMQPARSLYHTGYSLGRATRLAAGIDDTGATP